LQIFERGGRLAQALVFHRLNLHDEAAPASQYEGM
jgi:hypothetical protein